MRKDLDQKLTKKEIAQEAKSGYGLYKVGLICEELNLPEKALDLYVKSAQQGFSEAQFDLANILFRCCLPEARKAAITWYRKAADQKYGPAQVQLGLAYEQGQGVEKDIKEAIRLYHLAEEQFEDVQYRLGMCYEQLGKLELAQKHYLQAAHQKTNVTLFSDSRDKRQRPNPLPPPIPHR
jgi:TPR repeat protein